MCLCQVWPCMHWLPAREVSKLPQLPAVCHSISHFVGLVISPTPHQLPTLQATSPDSAVCLDISLPSISSILGTYVPTLQHVPKGARDCWVDVLSSLLVPTALTSQGGLSYPCYISVCWPTLHLSDPWTF